MTKIVKMSDQPLPVPNIVGTIDDWNNRSQFRKYYKLTDNDIIYEIPFPDKLFFYFIEYIKDSGIESNYISHIPEKLDLI